MTGPRHHPTEELLLAYAAGTAPEAVALIVATHLALCPRCRADVAALEAVGGAVLERLEPDPPSPDLLARTLARLDEPQERPAAVPSPPPPEVAFLPEPLRGYVGDRIPWAFVAPGIRKLELPVRFGDQTVLLTRVRGGTVVPTHGHRGAELQLVLAGGFTDPEHGHFVRGDVQCADDELVHGITIDRGEPCVTLLVKEAPLVQKTLLGRLFAAITGV